MGPWRGKCQDLLSYQEALCKWQSISNWPVFADPLSAISIDQPGIIGNWDLLLGFGLSIPIEGIQVLRLGPMPSSRSLEDWLKTLGKGQVLITEGDSRNLDPLGLSSQWSKGFLVWLNNLLFFSLNNF